MTRSSKNSKNLLQCSVDAYRIQWSQYSQGELSNNNSSPKSNLTYVRGERVECRPSFNFEWLIRHHKSTCAGAWARCIHNTNHMNHNNGIFRLERFGFWILIYCYYWRTAVYLIPICHLSFFFLCAPEWFRGSPLLGAFFFIRDLRNNGIQIAGGSLKLNYLMGARGWLMLSETKLKDLQKKIQWISLKNDVKRDCFWTGQRVQVCNFSFNFLKIF